MSSSQHDFEAREGAAAGPRGAKREASPIASGPVLAVGVLAHNEEGSIRRMLASLARQSLWRRTPSGRRQIVVYANGCTDRTAEVARRFRDDIDGLEVVETAIRGKSQGWNALREHLRGDAEWWVFADADIILHWRALEHLFEAAAQHPEAAVISSTMVSSARFLPVRERGFLIAARIESERWKPQRREVSARLYAIRREVARSIQLPPGLLNEDLYLTRLLGADRIVRSPEARVFNREPQTAADLLRYQLRTRIGSFQARQVKSAGVDSNKTLEAVARRTRRYRHLSWRAWVGKALWLPFRLYVEWSARRVPLESLGESFWMEIDSSKLEPRRPKELNGRVVLAHDLDDTLGRALEEPERLLASEGASFVKDHRRTAVAMLRVAGREIFVKRFKPYAWYRKLESRLRSPAQRSWENARLVALHGFSVPPALAFVDRGAESYFVTERVHDAEPAADFWLAGGGGGLSARRRILEEAARALRRFHDAGLYSRDTNANNFLIRIRPDGAPEFVVLDLENVRRPRTVRRRRRVKNLVQLYRLFRGRISRPAQLRFVLAYLGWAAPVRDPARRDELKAWLGALERVDLRKEAEYRRRGQASGG